MTIQFDCIGCRTPLRLPDEMAGTRVRCVTCGSVLTIPSPTEHYWPPSAQAAGAMLVSQSATAAPARPAPATISPVPPARHTVSETAAPLATPATLTSSAEASQAIPARPSVPGGANGSSQHAATGPQRASRPVPILETGNRAAPDEVDDRPASIRIDDVWPRTRGIYKHYFRSLVGAGLLLIALAAVVNTAVAAGLQLIGAGYVMRFCLGQMLLVWLMLGTMEFIVKTARGSRRGWTTLLGGMPHYGRGLAIWAVCFLPLALAAVIAGALGASPGLVAVALATSWLVVSFMIWIPALLALVDDQLTAFAALTQATDYAWRNLVPLTGLLGISIGILAISCLPLGLGLPLGIPFVLLLGTVAYLRDRVHRE